VSTAGVAPRPAAVPAGGANEGIWQLDAEPNGSDQGSMILPIGTSDLRGDLEGLALSYGDHEVRYLTVSDQGASTFHVLPLIGTERTHRFAIEGAHQTDGIEVATRSFGPSFPNGFFACHSDSSEACPILITPWAKR